MGVPSLRKGSPSHLGGQAEVRVRLPCPFLGLILFFIFLKQI